MVVLTVVITFMSFMALTYITSDSDDVLECNYIPALVISTLFISPILVMGFNKALEERELSVEESPNVIYERVVEQFKGDR